MREKIIESYVRCGSVGIVCEETGLSRNEVLKVVRDNYSEILKRQLDAVPEEMKQRVFEMKEDGLKNITISNYTGLSERTVGMILGTFDMSGAKVSNNRGNFDKSVDEIIARTSRNPMVEVTRYVKPEPETDANGNIQGYRVEMFLGIESPKVCKLPEWKIRFEKKGKVNYGYGYFPV